MVLQTINIRLARYLYNDDILNLALHWLVFGDTALGPPMNNRNIMEMLYDVMEMLYDVMEMIYDVMEMLYDVMEMLYDDTQDFYPSLRWWT